MVSEWVSVDDLFPLVDCEVLIRTIDEGDEIFHAGRYLSGVFEYYGWGGHGCGDEWQEVTGDVTHWILIQSPKI